MLARGRVCAALRRATGGARRFAEAAQTPSERALQDKLRASVQGVQDVEVQDTSGGCGTMFQILVSAEEFRGKSLVKQHQIIAKVLKDDIATWHGFTVTTRIPS